MNKLLWRFVGMMSGLLDPDERAVVLGDFAEARTRPVQALHEITGLALRRQAAAWKHWEPWAALIGIVIPLGALLSHVSRYVADWTSIMAFIYVSHWGWGNVDGIGPRRDLIHLLVVAATGSLPLIAWSLGRWFCSWARGSSHGVDERRSVSRRVVRGHARDHHVGATQCGELCGLLARVLQRRSSSVPAVLGGASRSRWNALQRRAPNCSTGSGSATGGGHRYPDAVEHQRPRAITGARPPRLAFI